jgi:8-oxo-dGTP pyrophosphatase MutT (NUDIX family)
VSEKVRPPPVEPVLSATILLLRDDPFEVLMVRRRSSSHFSSALVFPGGLVDPGDRAENWLPHVAGAEGLDETERALRIAACRESYEESSVVLGGHVHTFEPDIPFLDIVARQNAKLPLGDIPRFGHWITPVRAPKRFDTHFFIAAAPEGVEPKCDGDETVSLEWVRPVDAIARAEGGEHTIIFPTLMNLRMLAQSDDVDTALRVARTRPVVTVMPRVEKRPGGLVVVIPEEAGYGVTEYAAPEVAGKAE